jgi:hypothetical protein
MAVPKFGRTCLAHVEASLAQAAASVDEARVQVVRRLTKSEREALWRRLAGVVADVESVRIWLDMGAPR